MKKAFSKNLEEKIGKCEKKSCKFKVIPRYFCDIHFCELAEAFRKQTAQEIQSLLKEEWGKTTVCCASCENLMESLKKRYGL